MVLFSCWAKYGGIVTHGAYGLSKEYRIGNFYRTAISAKVIMGRLDIQRVIIAKGLLDKGRYRRRVK